MFQFIAERSAFQSDPAAAAAKRLCEYFEHPTDGFVKYAEERLQKDLVLLQGTLEQAGANRGKKLEQVCEKAGVKQDLLAAAMLSQSSKTFLPNQKKLDDGNFAFLQSIIAASLPKQEKQKIA